jgi:hypothetical protein
VRASLVFLPGFDVSIKPGAEHLACDDLLRAVCGFCLVSDQPGWEDQAVRQVELLVDGLRYRASRV